MESDFIVCPIPTSDFSEVYAIEYWAFKNSWTVKEMKAYVSKGGRVLGAYLKGKLLGYTFYNISTEVLYVDNFAVHSVHRREGVGFALMKKLVGKLDNRLRMLMLHVPQRNLEAQLFFKSCGLIAVAPIENFRDSGDVYAMRYLFIQSPLTKPK